MFTKASRSSHFPRARSAFTLPEFVAAVGIGGLILAQICLLWFYSSRSFAAQLSYSDMDQKSQRALDIFSQSIRGCKSLTNFSDTQIVLVDYDDKLVTFAFNNGYFTRAKGLEKPRTLLRDCKSGQFAIYQRTPISGGFDYYSTTDPNICKLVEVSWLCSRKIYPGGPATTETMQSARVVLRIK
jgi:hypothetical protein